MESLSDVWDLFVVIKPYNSLALDGAAGGISITAFWWENYLNAPDMLYATNSDTWTFSYANLNKKKDVEDVAKFIARVVSETMTWKDANRRKDGLGRLSTNTPTNPDVLRHCAQQLVTKHPEGILSNKMKEIQVG